MLWKYFVNISNQNVDTLKLYNAIQLYFNKAEKVKKIVI